MMLPSFHRDRPYRFKSHDKLVRKLCFGIRTREISKVGSILTPS